MLLFTAGAASSFCVTIATHVHYAQLSYVYHCTSCLPLGVTHMIKYTRLLSRKSLKMRLTTIIYAMRFCVNFKCNCPGSCWLCGCSMSASYSAKQIQFPSKVSNMTCNVQEVIRIEPSSASQIETIKQYHKKHERFLY